MTDVPVRFVPTDRAPDRPARMVDDFTPALIDVGEHQHAPFIVFEYVAGETLAAKLERLRASSAPLSRREAHELVPGRSRGYVEAVCHA